MTEYKYREYAFEGGKLFGIRYLTKLPKDAKKETSRENEVWVTPFFWCVWSKICRIDTDITFGTGRKDEFGDLPRQDK